MSSVTKSIYGSKVIATAGTKTTITCNFKATKIAIVNTSTFATLVYISNVLCVYGYLNNGLNSVTVSNYLTITSSSFSFTIPNARDNQTYYYFAIA